MTITQEILCELLRYCHATGVFTWRNKRAPGIHAGDRAGTLRSDGYIAIRVKGKKFQAHRLVWLYMHGQFPAAQIDHINGVKWDNRLVNLRLATNTENCRNRGARADSNSGIRGVSFERASGKWRATASDGRRYVSIGRFETIEAACAAYDAFTAVHHGEFKHQGSQP